MRPSLHERAATVFTTAGDLSSMLYDTMRIRMVEERIAELYPEQQMRCPVHLSIGQEGIAVGICHALAREDAVMSGHRAHAHYLAKGGDLKRMLAEIYGKETGCCKGRGGSMHLIDLAVNFLGSTPIVGGTIPIATGVAWAYHLRREPRVVVVFFGEGATEEGVWHESINFAELHKLPIIFVCENNLYSVYTHISERQPARSVSALAAAHGLRVLTGDGNNVAQVYDLGRQAQAHARSGQGPVFMELTTYRWREHCGPNYDNDLGYRSQVEFDEWRQRDPLEQLVHSALTAGLQTDELVAMKTRITHEIDEAVAFARESPFPVGESLYG